MTSKGRYKATEWMEFEEITDDEGKKKQKCVHCEQKISSKIERLREHLKRCNAYAKSVYTKDEGSDPDDQPSETEIINLAQTSTVDPISPPMKRSASSLSNTSTKSSESETPSCSKITQRIDKFVSKTTKAEKKLLDLQFARTFYANNIPFNVADNDQMKKLITMLKGGSYKPPNRRDLGGYLLDEVNEECEKLLATELEGKNVTLIQDGWSNVHNQPIIATCLHTGTKAFFIRSVDTGSEKKTAEYCSAIAEKEIDFCEAAYKCKVR